MGSKLIPISQEPRLLKDFLKDNTHSSVNFQHKKLFSQEMRNVTLFSNKSLSKFFVNAVKHLPFTSIKPPSILPRSISRRLSNTWRRNDDHNDLHDEKVKEISSRELKVKVKDILRWRSFRDDLIDDDEDEEPTPLDISYSPHHYTTVTTSTGSTNSSRSSWCDSDFSVEEDLQVESPCPCEDKEQKSPMSVLDFSFQDNDEEQRPFSFSQQNTTYFQPKKMQTKGIFTRNDSIIKDETNDVQEKAMELLTLARGTSFVESYEDLLLLDFFSERLISTANKKHMHDETIFDHYSKELRVAKAWIIGEEDGCLEWELVGKKEFSVRDMERGVRWDKFEDDEQELGLEMEKYLLNHLVDELLIDLLN